MIPKVKRAIVKRYEQLLQKTHRKEAQQIVCSEFMNISRATLYNYVKAIKPALLNAYVKKSSKRLDNFRRQNQGQKKARLLD
jgi:uncharacterized protein (DUF2344 family)